MGRPDITRTPLRRVQRLKFSTITIRRTQGRTLPFAVGPTEGRSCGSLRAARCTVLILRPPPDTPYRRRVGGSPSLFFTAEMPNTILMLAWRASCPSISIFRARCQFGHSGDACASRSVVGSGGKWLTSTARIGCLERGNVSSASRATPRERLRGASKPVVQFLYDGRYLLMGAALTTLL